MTIHAQRVRVQAYKKNSRTGKFEYERERGSSTWNERQQSRREFNPWVPKRKNLAQTMMERNRRSIEAVPPTVEIAEDKASASALARALLREAAGEAVAERGWCSVAIAGGSVIGALDGLYDEMKPEIEERIHWWFVDERVVPWDSPDSNYGAAQRGFMGPEERTIGRAHVISREPESAEIEAKKMQFELQEYPSNMLPKYKGIPIFDFILLGIGEDGHVASLFPGREDLLMPQGDPAPIVIPVHNSPKPPSDRISFTMSVITAAKKVVILAMGQGKSIPVRLTLTPTARFDAPCKMVTDINPNVTWILDAPAAKLISQDHDSIPGITGPQNSKNTFLDI